MPRMLGELEAFVTISPDTSGFREKADAGIRSELAGLDPTVPVGVDIQGLPEAVARMRAIMRMMGLADFLDVNIPVGKLMSQIQLIKRLLSQAGVADMLDVDLNKASLAKAEAEVGSLSATVPVTFDVSHLPVLGPIGSLGQQVPVSWNIPPLEPELIAATFGDHVDIPVDFDITRLPVMGPAGTLTEDIKVGWDVLPLAPIIERETAAAELAAKESLQLAAAEAYDMGLHIPVSWDIVPLGPMAAAAARGITEDIEVDWDLLPLAPLAAAQAALVQPEKLRIDWEIPLLKPLIEAEGAGLSETIPVDLDVSGTASIAAAGKTLAQLVSDAAGGSHELAVMNGSLMTAAANAVSMRQAVQNDSAALVILSGDLMKAVAASQNFVQLGNAVGSLDAMLKLLADQQALNAENDVLLAAGAKVQTDGYMALSAAIGQNSSVISGWKEAVAGVVTDTDSAKASILGMAGGAALASAGMMGLLGTFRETAGLMSWAGIIHSIFMLSMEFLAVAIPALIAFGAAADDQLQAWQDMYERMYAINVVGQSIGQTFGKTDGQILGLGDSLQKAQNAVQTQVYEILGAAINVMSGNIAGATDKTSKFADGFNTMGMSVTKTMDQFAAKVDVDLGTSTEQYIGLINKGAQDLTEFGEILGNVGHAILNFASDMPGLAEIVLKVITGISGLVLWLSKLPPMLITVVMAIEEAYRWSGYLAAVFGLIGSAITMLGSLGLPILATIGANISKMFAALVTGAAGAVANLTRIASTMAEGLGFAGAADAIEGAGTGMVESLTGVAAFLTGPWGIAIGLAVGALAVLGVWIANTKSQTQQWTDSLESVVTKSVGLAQIGATYGALTAVTKQYAVAQSNVNTVLSNKSAAENAAFAQKEMNEGMGEGTAIAQQYSMALQKAQGQAAPLSAAQKTLAQDFSTEGSNVAFLAKTYGVTYPEAAILAGNANANLTQTMQGNTVAAKNNLQMVKNYIAGMGGMGPISGALGSDINAVTIDASLQGTEVQKLTTAWSDVMQMVQAPDAGFLSLGQSLVTFGNDAKASGASMTGLGGTIGKISDTFPKMNSASLQLQSDFNASASAAQTLINSLYVTAAVTGNNSLLMQGLRDTIAILIPMAGKNQAAAAQIHVLAQEAGLGGLSMSALAKATGKTKDPLDNLYKISGQASGQLADLGQDAQNLADTVQTSLNQTLVVAAQSLEGVSGKTAVYLKDLQNLGSASPVTQAALADLNGAVSSSNVLAGQAASGITALSGDNTKLGKATAAQQANRQTLYNDINDITKIAPSVGRAIGSMVTAVETQGTQSLAYHTDRQTLYNDLVQLKIPIPEINTMLGNLTTAAGLTGNAADKLAIQHLAPLGTGIDTLAGKARNMAQYFTDPVIPALNRTGDAAITNQAKVKILEDQLNDLPKSVTTNVNVHASGSGGMSFTEKVAQSVSSGSFALGVSTLAAGGKITAGTGPKTDDVLARVSRGETVVSAADSKVLAPYFKALGVPGYASGGIPAMVPWAKNAEVSFAQSAETSFLASIEASLKDTVTAAAKATSAAYNGPGTLSAQAIEGYWTGAGGPGGQVANIAQAITGPESGRRPGAVQQGQPYGCVPLSTRILTRRGWLAHDQVQPGDQTIGYNPAAGRSEWTTITAVHHYDDAEVWRIGNKRWSADVTPDHRWWSDTETETGTRGEFVRTRDLGAHHRIRLAAPADTDGIPGLFLHECAIIGWLMGDGRVLKDTSGAGNELAPEVGWEARIYQSKPEQVTRIRALLAGIPHTERTRQRGPARMLSHEFRLHRVYANDLLKRAHWGEMTPEEFVLALSPDQRTAWLAAIIDAEGNHVKDTVAERSPARGARPAPGTFTRISQVDGPIQDAITLAVYLDGWNPSRSLVRPETSRQAHQQPAANIGMRRPHVTAGRSHTVTILGNFAVWCVSTKLGSWTADQDKHVFLTGNSTGWGLWQITPGNSEPQAGIDKALLNPHNNAIAAVAKYHGAGGFSPWTTYEDGLYLPYLMGGIQAPKSDPTPSGYAAGGVPAGLAAAQAKEAKDYASAIRQAGTPPGTEARKELARLIRDQSYETGAFADLESGGTTAGNLSWFKSQLAEMQSESAAKALSRAAPVSMETLHSELGTLLRLAGGVAPVSKSSSGSASGSAAAGKTSQASSVSAAAGKAKKLNPAQIAASGEKYLKAWDAQRNAMTVNAQIDKWNSRLHRDSTLAGASGLDKAQLKQYKAAAATDRRKIAALTGEKTTLQEWRTDLSGSDSSLSSWISAAGKTPSLAKNVKSWKYELGNQEKEIAEISKMLGWSAAQLAAQKAASAAGAASGGSGSAGGSGTTTITPVGLTPAGALAAFTAGISGAGAKVIPGFGGSFDNGGTLATGWNTVHNGTGRPEPLVPARRRANGLSADAEAIIAALRENTMAVQQGTIVAGTQGTQLGRALNGQAPAKRALTGAGSLRRMPL